jgi:hypothetical protein
MKSTASNVEPTHDKMNDAYERWRRQVFGLADPASYASETVESGPVAPAFTASFAAAS